MSTINSSRQAVPDRISQHWWDFPVKGMRKILLRETHFKLHLWSLPCVLWVPPCMCAISCTITCASYAMSTLTCAILLTGFLSTTTFSSSSSALAFLASFTNSSVACFTLFPASCTTEWYTLHLYTCIISQIHIQQKFNYRALCPPQHTDWFLECTL